MLIESRPDAITIPRPAGRTASIPLLVRVPGAIFGLAALATAAAIRTEKIRVGGRVAWRELGVVLPYEVALALAFLGLALLLVLPPARVAVRQLRRRDAGWVVAVVLVVLGTLLPVRVAGQRAVLTLAVGSAGLAWTLAGLWPVFRGPADRLRRFIGAVLDAWPPVWTAIAAAAVVLGAAAFFSSTLFDRSPHVHDSIAQLFQAEVFARGRVSLPAPGERTAFEYAHIVTGPLWYAQYPPGHPLMLAAGVLAGAPWLVNPLLGALTVLVVFAIGREIYGARTGVIAACLAALSPFLLFMSSEFMNHATSLFWLSVFIFAFARTMRTGSVAAAALCGAAVGAAGATRPLTALSMAVPFGLVALADFRRRPRDLVKPLAVMVATALVFVAGMLAYNAATTGDPLLFGYEARYGTEHGMGFGHSGWGEPHSPRRGLVQTLSNLNALQLMLFEWPVPSLVLVAALFASGRARRWDWLLVWSWIALAVAYLFYWYQDLCFGPRFQYEALAPLVLLTARGIEATPDLLSRRFGLAVPRPRVATVLVAAIALSIVWTGAVAVPALARTYGNDYWGTTSTIYRAVPRGALTNAIVLVNSDYTGFGPAFLRNFEGGATFDGPVIYARNVAGVAATLARLMPERRLWLTDDTRLEPLASPDAAVAPQARVWDRAWQLTGRCESGAGPPGVVFAYWSDAPPGDPPVLLRTDAGGSGEACLIERELTPRPGEWLHIVVGWAGLRASGDPPAVQLAIDGAPSAEWRLPADNAWHVFSHDLSAHAGRTIRVSLNASSNARREAVYWGAVKVGSESGPGRLLLPASVVPPSSLETQLPHTVARESEHGVGRSLTASKRADPDP